MVSHTAKGFCELAKKVRNHRFRPASAPVTQVRIHDRRAFLDALPVGVQVRHRKPLVNRQVHNGPLDPVRRRDRQRSFRRFESRLWSSRGSGAARRCI